MAESSRGVRSSQKSGDACVICLEPISERAIAVPCNHCAFDFLCIVSWLQDHQTCPLCKTQLSAVEYDWRSPDDFTTYHVRKQHSRARSDELPNGISQNRSLYRLQRRPRRSPHPNAIDPGAQHRATISRRRQIYREKLYSLHVGVNRISRFTDFTPELFNASPDMQCRARKWIRRELQVFDFLNPESGEQTSVARRANNAEFLLSYVIALLRTVDVRSSSGKAEVKLADFLGLDNSRLFLHELAAWLRSPYTRLEDWDRATQYADGFSGGGILTPERRPHKKASQPLSASYTRANHD